MQTTWDADDFLRRGILGSIMGFRKRAGSRTEGASSASSSTQPQNLASASREEVDQPIAQRSEYEIYREIVTEAELIERSATASPTSEISSPTTPQPFNPPQFLPLPPNSCYPPPPTSMLQYDDQKNYPPYHMVMTPTAPHPIPVDQHGVPLGAQCPMAPPPYTSYQVQGTSAPQMDQMPYIPYEMKKEIHEHLAVVGKQSVSIEEIVKMVVTALKDSNIEECQEETPEEILKRKRIQNNMAAARYRKRQREAKEVAEHELNDLAKRNEELRNTVAKMEQEIAHFKNIVLRGS